MGKDVIKTFEEIVVKNIKNGKYKSNSDTRNLIGYIMGKSKDSDNQKPVRYTGGYGVPYYDFDMCCNAMGIIKKYYKKNKKSLRKVYHFIISFPEYINDVNIVKIISVNICQHFYYNGFQCFYGIHEDTKNLHIHIAVNSTSFTTGKQMHFSYNELKTFKTTLKKTAYKILKENYY